MLKKTLGRLWLRLNGWEIEGEVPTATRYVMIAAPHTTNWDFPHTLAMSFALSLPIHWLGKKELFAGPFGGLLERLGGIPVDRSRRGDLVEMLAQRMRDEEGFVLLVPAEGTRARRAYWKSGFYHIARGAGVPIALGYLDYARRRGGVGPLLVPGDDLRADMDTIRAFYQDIQGKEPARFTPPRLREEDALLKAAS